MEEKDFKMEEKDFTMEQAREFDREFLNLAEQAREFDREFLKEAEYINTKLKSLTKEITHLIVGLGNVGSFDFVFKSLRGSVNKRLKEFQGIK